MRDTRSLAARRRWWPAAAIASLVAVTTVAAAMEVPRPQLARTRINDAALADETNTAEWLAYGRTYSGQRFSPLDQINASNVKDLKVDWYLDLPNEAGIVSTPLVADGRIYFRTSKDVVYAADAVTGKPLWTYDPKIGAVMNDPERHPELYFLHGGRGLSLWHDKLYTASVDGRLIALDPRTGQEVWSVQTFDPKSAQYIVGAPIAFHGKVILGIAGTEFGSVKDGKTSWNRGYVTAYDADTGKEAWRFWIVPGNPANGFENKAMAMAAKTWPEGWWKLGGGGHAWGEGFTYDPEQNLLFIGTGNPNPLPRKSRGKGDALFSDSIVAVDADTGEYRWHYQLNPSEQWGWDAITPMITADLKVRGKTVKALMLAPKNGFFYVLDRTTGKVVSAEPYTKQNWAKKIDLKTGRPVELPDADYSALGKATVWPGASGPRSWEANSYNPKTGLVYIASHDQATKYELGGQNLWGRRAEGFSGYYMLDSGFELKGTLQAWDPVKQKRAWEVAMPGPIAAGTMTTGGNLVFHGEADGQFVAYDATTGQALWRYPLGEGITAPAITYALNGRQYVAQLIGYGSSHTGFPEAKRMGWQYGHQMRRLVVFSLDGKATLPPQPPPQVPVPAQCPDFKVDTALADKGAGLVSACFLCHSGSLAPNLLASTVPCYKEAFETTVHNGRPELRMPPFKQFSDDDLVAIQHYLRASAEEALKKQANAGP